MIKVCKSCGRYVEEEWEFCPFCGAELIEEQI